MYDSLAIFQQHCLEMIRKKYRHQDDQLKGEYSKARLHINP